MKIGSHFTLEELTRSQTAARKGIDNSPDEKVIACLQSLVKNILDPLRDAVGPVFVSSGFRCVTLNRMIGGAANSQHCLGQAADINVRGYSVAELAAYIKLLHLPFDQVIDEFGRWVHVSYSPRQRRQVLTARSIGGKTVYASS